MLLSKLNTDINEKTQLANQSKQTIDGLIASINAKNEELRKFIQDRLDICNDTQIVAKNQRSLEEIIRQLNTDVVQLQLLSLEIARTLPQLETNRAAIIAKIQTEIRQCNLPATLAALDPPTITAIGREIDGLNRGYDELNHKSARKLTDVAAIYTRNDTTATTMKQDIEDCIQMRKAVAAAWQNSVVDSIAKMMPIAIKCKASIDALCKMADSGAINKVDATNPAKVGLTGRLDALKQSCSAFNEKLRKCIPSLYDVPPTAHSIEKNLQDILVYQQSLDDPAIGNTQLKTQYDKALASVNTLTAHKHEIEQMITELTRYEVEIGAIKTDIGSVIAAQEEAASAAADINVFDDLKTRPFSGVSFNERTGNLILSFGNAQQPLNVPETDTGSDLSRQAPSPRKSDDEADEESAPVSEGPSGVGRRRLAAANGPYSVVITPKSPFYKKLVLGKDPQYIWLREINLPGLTAEIGAKNVNLIEGAVASPKVEPTDKLAIAKAAALNPVVVRTLLAGIQGIDEETLKKYDILVRLCDKGSAAGVINEMLIDKKLITPTPAPGAAGFGIGVGIKPNTAREMVISDINGSGGAAATRQIREGDIITGVDEHTITSKEDAIKLLAGPSGSECLLRLKRYNGVGADHEIITVKVRRIPPLPEPQKKWNPSIVNNILQKLGWTGSENKVWYNIDKDTRAGGYNLIGGLFSLFSYTNRNLSTFLSAKLCKTNYVCMLNWIFLIALRTNILLVIKELIRNIYTSIYGFILSDMNFQNYFRDVTPFTNVYIVRVNQNLHNIVFTDRTLEPIISIIRGELQRELDESRPLPSSPRSGAASPPPSNIGWVGGSHKKKTRMINRKIDSHHTIKKHSIRESERGGKMTRRRHHKLLAKRRLDRVKTRRSAPVYFSV